MPLYEYQCEACEHRFEVIQKFSDPPPASCPKCGAPVHKLQSAPAIQFKGTGWYITDYAKKDSTKKDSTKDDKPAPKADEGGKGGGADSSTPSKDAGSGETKAKSETSATAAPSTTGAKESSPSSSSKTQ